MLVAISLRGKFTTLDIFRLLELPTQIFKDFQNTKQVVLSTGNPAFVILLRISISIGNNRSKVLSSAPVLEFRFHRLSGKIPPPK
jgi:hypothetical protein